MRLAILLLTSLNVASLLAQLGPEHRFLYPAPGTAVALFDMDGDGDGDLVRNVAGHLLVHEQLSPTQYRVVADIPGAGTAYHLRIADLDGDVIDDVVFADTPGGRIAWSRNTGGGNFDPVQDLLMGITSPYDVRIADVDADGDQDLVHADGLLTLSWNENLGGAVFGPSQIIFNAIAPTGYPEFSNLFDLADLDNDGDPDLATVLPDLQWFENDGNGGFTGAILPGSMGCNDLVLCDMDGDLDTDIVLTRTDGNGSALLHVENLGGGWLGPVVPSGISGIPETYLVGLTAGDTDGDGDLDITFQASGLVSAPHTTNSAINAGNGMFTTAIGVLSMDNFGALALGDLNGDTLVDIVARTNDAIVVLPGGSAVPHRVSSVTAPTRIRAAVNSLGGTSHAIVTGQTYFSPLSEGSRPLQAARHGNLGGGTMREDPGVIQESAAPIHSTSPIDLDNDGDDDLVAVWVEPETGTFKRYMVFLNNGGSYDSITAIGPQFFAIFPSDPLVPPLRDLDGDGDIDMVRYVYYDLNANMNNGNGYFAPEQTYQVSGAYIPRAFSLCDVDQDNAPDFVWGQASMGGADSIFWSANNGSGIPGPAQPIGQAPISTFANALIASPVLHGQDLNSDGLEDLVIFNGDSIAFLLNNGTTLVNSQAFACTAKAYELGDMDGNGLPEAVAIRSNGDVITWLNQGGGLFGPELLIADASFSTGTDHLDLADMDGDGDLDVLTCSASGSAAWLENNGNFPTIVPAQQQPAAKMQVIPNPFHDQARITFSEPMGSDARIDLLDAQGRLVSTLNGNGSREVIIEREGLGAGLYLVRVVLDGVQLGAMRIVAE